MWLSSLCGEMWSQRHKNVVYFNNKCGPIIVGPHFRRYIEQKM